TLLGAIEQDDGARRLAAEGGRAFVSASLRPYVIAALADRDEAARERPMLVVVGDDRAARDLAGDLGAWLAPRRVRYYPSRGVAYESHLAPPPHLVGLRVAALAALLGAAGYERVDQVEERGQFAMRGGLLDVFPATEDRAVRVDMFDVEIESLRWFSTFTQRSLGDAEEIEIAPAAELAAEHRELAEIAASTGAFTGEDASGERPDIAELLPVERFGAFLD